ncbi:MAG: hypothetical protein Q9162_006311 [Coniocarpon cinnabarinum]
MIIQSRNFPLLESRNLLPLKFKNLCPSITSPSQPIPAATSPVPSPVLPCGPINGLPALNETAEERSKRWSDAVRRAFDQQVRSPTCANHSRLHRERHAAIEYFLHYPDAPPQQGQASDRKAKHDAKTYWEFDGDRIYRKADNKFKGRRLYVDAPEAFEAIAAYHVRHGHSGTTSTWKRTREDTYGCSEDEVKIVVSACAMYKDKAKPKGGPPFLTARKPARALKMARDVPPLATRLVPALKIVADAKRPISAFAQRSRRRTTDILSGGKDVPQVGLPQTA